MLADKKLKAFIPTVKPAEAKIFYSNALGLRFLSEDKFALEFDSGGTVIRVSIVRELKPQEFTILGWDVTDIKKDIGELNSKGVYCEKYGFLEQDELGIWSAPGGAKVAWFKDPDGNILSLTQY